MLKILASLALLTTSAFAADMPLKAPIAPVPACSISYCVSWFVGGNLANAGGNFDVLGSGINGLASNGISGGMQAGYEFFNGPWFARATGMIDYDITNNGPTGSGLVGFGNNGQFAYGGVIDVGYSLAGFFGASTTGSTISLPAALANALMSPYVSVGTWRQPWGTGLVTGGGFQGLIATNWTWDARYWHINYNNAAYNPIVAQQSENRFIFQIDRHFSSNF